MIVDVKAEENNVFGLQPRKLLTWQEDVTVKECCGCGKIFGLRLGQISWERKHHCRYCGYIFCGACSNQSVIIPQFAVIPKNNKGEDESRETPMRVCWNCFKKINQYSVIKNIIQVFDLIGITVEDIRIMRQVCSVWRQYADYHLSQFRTLQYKLPYDKFTAYERKLLWTNRKLFVGHDIWMAQLIRSIDYVVDHHRLPEIIELLESGCGLRREKKKKCSVLMCTRGCRINSPAESLLSLCDFNILSKEIHEYALKRLGEDPTQEYLRYLPLLIQHGMKSGFQTIHHWLINLAQRNNMLANSIYWYIQIGLSSGDSSAVTKWNTLKIEWEKYISDEIKNRIGLSQRFTKLVEEYYQHKDLDLLKKQLKRLPQIYVPVDIDWVDLKLKVDKIRITSSHTAPLIFEFEDRQGHTRNFLYKPEDVRQDYIVMTVIGVMDEILKRELDDMNIVQYKIQPTSSAGGFIEMVPKCETLYHVRVSRQLKLINYILEQNPRAEVNFLRQNFKKSTAAYCAITYLLGVGDRHLNNIMITKDGRLFHIDYGYILGRDPKLFDNVMMRISEDIVDALGGINSQNYHQFTELCADSIYNCLRRHVNIIAYFLDLLYLADPPIDTGRTQEYLHQQINRRFLPGETYHQAEINFHNRIDNSTTQTYHYTITDMFHRSSQDGLLKHVNQTIQKTKSYFQNFYCLLFNDTP